MSWHHGAWSRRNVWMTEQRGARVSLRCHPPDSGAAAAPASLPGPASIRPRNQALSAGMPVAGGHLARPCRALHAGGTARPSKQDTCLEAGGWGSHGGRPSGLGSRGRSVAGQGRGSRDAPIQAAERLNGARALSRPAGCGRQPGTITRTAVGRGGEMAGVASVRVGPGRTQDSSVIDPRGHRGTV